MSDRLFILGAGRAGRGLARALRASGVTVLGLHGRTAEAGYPAVTAGAIPGVLGEAGVVLVAVRDAQLESALRELLAAGLAPGAVVLHVSGSAPDALLAPLRAAGHPAGTFHPLLPLSSAAEAPRLLHGAWIGVDGDPDARGAARRLAAVIGARTLEIPDGEKARYHAAAVFASNFPIVLAEIAAGLLIDAGVPGAEAREAVQGLLAAAALNLRGRAPAEALTGPVARGDVGTVQAHLAALTGDARAIYVTLARAAVDLARDAGASPDALARIRALLA